MRFLVSPIWDSPVRIPSKAARQNSSNSKAWIQIPNPLSSKLFRSSCSPADSRLWKFILPPSSPRGVISGRRTKSKKEEKGSEANSKRWINFSGMVIKMAVRVRNFKEIPRLVPKFYSVCYGSYQSSRGGIDNLWLRWLSSSHECLRNNKKLEWSRSLHSQR
ncbi:unnamed protein product [Coffea canephora]|uniref:Uncharacterized protein n=1 Tax=Coffea canephora TaxID=49390 RepID=A0A068U6P2_COFCA|nr:unnamed protein product [Coffea canephora]